MIIYTEDKNASKEIFDALPTQEKKFLISSGEYNQSENFIFSLLYKKNKKSIAFADILIDPNYKQPYIALAVLPDYRHQCIASKLLRASEIELIGRKYIILYYTINNPTNFPSINFALRHGFIEQNNIGGFIVYKKPLCI